MEVRNDYTDDDNYTHIDYYKTDDDNEQGKTVAIVCRDTSKVYYIDNAFRNDEACTIAIKEVLDSILKDKGLMRLDGNLDEVRERIVKANAEMFLFLEDEDIDDVLERIASHDNHDDLVDYVDGITMIEKFEYTLTVKQFLETIGYYK